MPLRLQETHSTDLVGFVRQCCLAVLLSVSALQAHAAITIADEDVSLSGTGLQDAYVINPGTGLPKFAISQPGMVTATLTDLGTPSAFGSLGMSVLRSGGASVGSLLAAGSFDFNVSSTTVGNYSILVFGVPGSSSSTLNVTLTLAPIPEPEIWAMMLVGGGLVGLQLRRKRRALQANRLLPR